MDVKNQKGITLVAEVLTVMVFVIFITTISFSSMSSLKVRELNNMYGDILAIQEKAINYYAKYGEAPVSEEGKLDKNNDLNTELVETQLNLNDDPDEYYKVDFSKLLNVFLNVKQTDERYYLINAKTLTVYYNLGVEIDNANITVNEEGTPVKYKKYFTIPSNYKGVTKMNLSIYQ